MQIHCNFELIQLPLVTVMCLAATNESVLNMVDT